MSSILAIDTSTNRGSVAVLGEDGTLLFAEDFSADRTHSAALFSVLERAKLAAGEIGCLAVGLGPGSYAGVRISIAAALGFQLVTDAELVGVASVSALETELESYVAIGDARRETFYWTRVESGTCTQGPELIDQTELERRIATETSPLFVTELLPLCPQAHQALPSATRIAKNAAARRGILATTDLEPIYLREPHITPPKKTLTPANKPSPTTAPSTPTE